MHIISSITSYLAAKSYITSEISSGTMCAALAIVITYLWEALEPLKDLKRVKIYFLPMAPMLASFFLKYMTESQKDRLLHYRPVSAFLDASNAFLRLRSVSRTVAGCFSVSQGNRQNIINWARTPVPGPCHFDFLLEVYWDCVQGTSERERERERERVCVHTDVLS